MCGHAAAVKIEKVVTNFYEWQGSGNMQAHVYIGTALPLGLAMCNMPQTH